MGIKKWIPWQIIARKAAKAYGFNDPVQTLSRIRKFSRPSETNEPIELLRAGFAFHARGLANTKAIQNNLDWIWPYWIERQYDPNDVSFIPRAFSFSHINLTHRNWTAVSVPGSEHYSVVDPRGLVTPFHDSWSLDFWIVTQSGRQLFPSKTKHAKQALAIDDLISVETRVACDGLELHSTVSMEQTGANDQKLSIHLRASANEASSLVIAIRPYNPEGIQFIDTIEILRQKSELLVNGENCIQLPKEVGQYFLSNYEQGDVSHELSSISQNDSISCEAGMATAAATVKMDAGKELDTKITIPIQTRANCDATPTITKSWKENLSRMTQLELPIEEEQQQFEQSITALAQLSAGEIYPGPYTYKRFWFRDACLIANALLRTGQFAACKRALLGFPSRQTKDGYFLSQEGEWDSNGQVLWIYDKYEQLTGEKLPSSCFDSISPAIEWIGKKLVSAPGTPVDGLLPAGFSAEHFGPNDHYYWDDFWAVAGLLSAAKILNRRGLSDAASHAEGQALTMLECIENSLQMLSSKRASGRMPASPYRRMDSGAIGSLVADYPLKLFSPRDTRVMGTADFLYERCTFDDAFFQDMIHSGINIYLTIDLAQTFLRAQDPRWEPLIDKCLELATSTGQWPEAIHPKTLGGCMGDGQHAWAAAEWVNFAIDRIVREEGNRLIIGSGVSKKWIKSGSPIKILNTPTRFGKVSVTIEPQHEGVLSVTVQCDSHSSPTPTIEYSVPGYDSLEGKFLGKVNLYPINANVSAR